MQTSADPIHNLGAKLQAIEQRYANGQERPLGGYVALASVYSLSVAGAVAVLRHRRVRLPDRVGWSDLILMTVATYKASRLVAKDSVTAAFRAPFTTFQEPAGEGEVNEMVHGRGVRHAVGELVTCPFCLSVWVATGFAIGFVVWPRPARLLASVLFAVAGSDYLQLGYGAMQRLA